MNCKKCKNNKPNVWGLVGAIILLAALIACLVLARRVYILTGQMEALTNAEQEPVVIATAEAEPEAVIDTTDTVEIEVEVEPVEHQAATVGRLSFMYTAEDVELIGRTIWGEAGGIASTAERAAVAWCILNRADLWHQSIEEVVTAPAQFQGYRPEGDCPQEHLDLAAEVLARWEAEHQGADDVGRVLPREYLFFLGDGRHNHFTKEWQGTDTWGWTLPDPYI